MRTDTSTTQGTEAVAACLASPLASQLAAAGIIPKAGVRRCRRRVGRLARQFPASDYLWVEALQRRGYLTLFQARTLTEHPPDALVVGDYVLLDQVGGSDLATSFRARHRRTRQATAVRVFNRDLGDASALGRKLQQYQRQCAAVGAPQIVEPLEIGEAGDRVFVAAPWVDGPPLSEIIKRRGRIPSRQALEIARQIGAALAAAQRQGLVHGDLRPSNVLIALDGAVRLTDFSLRWLVAPETLKPRLTVGPERYEYLAPEITVGAGRPGTRSELYSLGCLLYHMIAGRAPFPGGDAHSKCAAHQTRQAPDLSLAAPEADRALVELVHRTMDRDPSRRPANFDVWVTQIGPSTHETRRRLASYVGGSSWREQPAAGGPHAAFGAPPESPPARRRWGWLAAAVVVAGLGAGLTLRTPSVRRWIPLSFSRLAGTNPADTRDTSSSPPPANARPGDRSGGRAFSGATHTIDPHDHASARLRDAVRAADDGDTIELRTAGPFVVEDLVIARRLVLRGAPDVRPLLLVRKGKPGMVLLARGVRLENLHFVYVDGPEQGEKRPAAAQQPTASATMLEVSASAALDRCSFHNRATTAGPPVCAVLFAPMEEPASAAIGRAQVRTDPAAAGRASETLEVTDCYFRNLDAAIRLTTPASSHATPASADPGHGDLTVRADNCLQYGGGPFARILAQARNDKLRLSLKSVSSIQTHALIEYRTTRLSQEAGPFDLTVESCVSFPAEEGAVVRLAYPDPDEPPLPPAHIAWAGTANRCPPAASTLVVEGPGSRRYLTATGPNGWADAWPSAEGGFSAIASAPPPPPADESHPKNRTDGVQKSHPSAAEAGVTMSRLWFPGEPLWQELPSLLHRAWNDLPQAKAPF